MAVGPQEELMDTSLETACPEVAPYYSESRWTLVVSGMQNK